MPRNPAVTPRITPFGIRVRKELIDRRMTERQLAEAIGKNYSTMNGVITGYIVSAPVTEAIKKYFEWKE
jgi:hypothetical protein